MTAPLSLPTPRLVMRLSRIALFALTLAALPMVATAQDCLGFHRPQAVATLELSSGFLRDGIYGPSQVGVHLSRSKTFAMIETGAYPPEGSSAFSFNGLAATLGYRTAWRQVALCAGGSLATERLGPTTTQAAQSVLVAVGLPPVQPIRWIPAIVPFGVARAVRGALETEGSDVRRATGVTFRAGIAAYPLPWIGLRVHQDYGEGIQRVGYSLSGRVPLGREDSDRDGIANRVDQCPGTPRGTVVMTDGCEPDEDNDGVPDARDACRGTRPDADVDARGCEPDDDRDGVPDVRDACPATPRGVPVSATGCPLDADGDGVFDVVDLCPNTPKGTPVNDRGCTVDVDGDGDGVPDARDRCPATPAGTVVDAAGCPRVRAQITLQGVTFETRRSVLRPSSAAVLDTVAEALLADPSARVELAGHTDDVGTDRRNEALSLARARAVRAYLIIKGVAPDRMTAVGYGSSRPVAPNTTSEGRAQNRRVEMTRTDLATP